jgi:glutamyl-tRNA reductase
MKILVVGLNHKTAPIEVRERLSFDATRTLAVLRELVSRFGAAEFVLLSTCNRTELYCAASEEEQVKHPELSRFLAEFQGLEEKDFTDCLYIYGDEDAVRHLLTVASSLDSMVVGEEQILGQVKQSYRLGCAARSTGKVLNRLFHCAFATSKKVRTTTSISSGRLSIAGIAVELAMQVFAEIASARVVVIGAGEMGQLVVQHLLDEGCRNITVVNRSYERGLETGRRYGVQVRRWEGLEEELVGANIVVASAAVQDYLFRKERFEEIMKGRRQGPLLVVDIAVPRNFEPSINEIEEVYLYSVDELSDVAEENRKAREEDVCRGMEIIYENAAEFMEWFSGKDIGPLIGQMREKFARISREELERFFVGARRDASCKDVMEPMVNRIVNRLLHCVIKNVNIVAKERGASEAAKMVEEIVEHADEIISEGGDKEDAGR